MFPPYKLYHQGAGDITTHIYIFLNNDWIEDHILSLEKGVGELNTWLAEKSLERLSFIFSQDELTMIDKENIPVTFIPQPLHLDDTVSIIKSKIIEMTQLPISLPEIYLYAIREEKLNAQSLYAKLTQDGELPLTRKRMMQTLQNFVRFNVKDFKHIEDRIFTHEDLLPYTERVERIKFPIGQKFIIEKKYPIMTSPFGIFSVDPVLKNHGERITSTENKFFLLEYGPLVSNIIYLCSAEDVVKSATTTEEAEMKIKIYYPHLYKEKIYNLEELQKRKHYLLETNKKLLDINFKKYNNNINLFYNLYYNRDVILPVTTYGIKYLHFIIHPITIINFPIDIIFKLIHATQRIPLSKWNPGKRRENIYRIYTPQTSKDGRKIPQLPKSEIMKIIRTVGRKKSVSITIQLERKKYIICEFFDNGNISIKCTFHPTETSPVDVRIVENIIREQINPILNTIENFLEQSGYEYFLFKNLHEPNIEIVDISYLYSLPVAEKTTLKDIPEFKKCLSSVFNIAGDEMLIYKRVAHFNKEDSIDAFITLLYKQDTDPVAIIKQLEDYFSLDKKMATAEYARWVDARQVERGRFENKKIKIINNPGFPIQVQWKEGHVDLIVNNINNIYYLDLLPIYLNTMIKLTQYKNFIDGSEEEFFTQRINSICKEGVEAGATLFPEIKAANEKSFSQQTEVSADEGLVSFGDDGSVDSDLLGIFGGGSDTDEDTDRDEDSVSQKEEVKKSAPSKEKGSKKAPSHRSMPENIEGISLTNPNYFQKRLERADPILFLKKKQGKFKQYSRSCAVNIRRQPVLLTEEEFEEIKTNSPEKIKMAVKYGSNPEKQYWYACPQYWCLSENIPLTVEDLDKAKASKTKLCGSNIDPYKNIIPRNAKTVPKGKYIYSRLDFGQKKRKQVQETLYPSFFCKQAPQFKIMHPLLF